MVTNLEIETIHVDTSGDVSKINQTTVLRKKNFIRKGTFSILCVVRYNTNFSVLVIKFEELIIINSFATKD